MKRTVLAVTSAAVLSVVLALGVGSASRAPVAGGTSVGWEITPSS